MKVIFVEALDLPDAWFQCLDEVLEFGREYLIEKGSFKGKKRLELDYITIQIKKPSNRPIIPEIPPGLNVPPPTSLEYVESYCLEYLMGGKVKEKSEDYTYGDRLARPPEPKKVILEIDGKVREFYELSIGKDQIERIVERYRAEGHNTNQNILQIAMPADLELVDPPCLRHIDTKIMKGTLHFYPYFRSWDLWAGLPTNLGGIQLLKEYMAERIGVEDGEIIASSKGLHLYDYAWELAKKRTYKSK